MGRMGSYLIPPAGPGGGLAQGLGIRLFAQGGGSTMHFSVQLIHSHDTHQKRCTSLPRRIGYRLTHYFYPVIRGLTCHGTRGAGGGVGVPPTICRKSGGEEEKHQEVGRAKGGVGLGWVGLGWVVACTGCGFPRPACPSLTSTTASNPCCLSLTAPADDP